MDEEREDRWCLVTNLAEWQTTVRHSSWAFDRESRMAPVKVGDMGVVYLTRAAGGYSSFGGLVRFLASDSVVDESIERTSKRFRHVVPIAVEVWLRSPVPLTRIKDQLEFLPNTPHWSTVLQGRPIIPISAHDFDLITEHVARNAEIELGRAGGPQA